MAAVVMRLPVPNIASQHLHSFPSSFFLLLRRKAWSQVDMWSPPHHHRIIILLFPFFFWKTPFSYPLPLVLLLVLLILSSSLNAGNREKGMSAWDNTPIMCTSESAARSSTFPGVEKSRPTSTLNPKSEKPTTMTLDPQLWSSWPILTTRLCGVWPYSTSKFDTRIVAWICIIYLLRPLCFLCHHGPLCLLCHNSSSSHRQANSSLHRNDNRSHHSKSNSSSHSQANSSLKFLNSVQLKRTS